MANAGLIRSSRKTPTKFDLNGYEPEFEKDGIPVCLKWTVKDVADWIEYLGFEQYRVRCHFDKQRLFFYRINNLFMSLK